MKGLGVEEQTGFEASFSISERVIQRAWLRRFFAQAGQTSEGCPWRLVAPGSWNLGPGPDFREGRWLVSGEGRSGAIELHLHSGDWFAHGHHLDPAYDSVRLHVVLYPPKPGQPRAVTRSGHEPDELILLPLLHCSLEELALDQALEQATGRDFLGLAEAWSSMSRAWVGSRLTALANRRWQDKLTFARLRLRRAGWSEACHCLALEVLGFRANRAAMANLVAHWPLGRMLAEEPGVERLLGCEASAWQWRGVRPMNRPDARLRQYLQWLRLAPDWPERMLTWGRCLARLVREAGERDTPGESRRAMDLAGVRERFRAEVVCDVVRGDRLCNLAVDLALPLSACVSDDEEALRHAWNIWWPANAPDGVLAVLNAVSAPKPICNGAVQGVLGALLEQRGIDTGACHAAPSAA